MGEPQVGDEFPIKLAFGEVRGIPVSMGNPHYVVFVTEFAPGWQEEAAEIGHHDVFKHGTNVELVVIKVPEQYQTPYSSSAGWARRALPAPGPAPQP